MVRKINSVLSVLITLIYLICLNNNPSFASTKIKNTDSCITNSNLALCVTKLITDALVTNPTLAIQEFEHYSSTTNGINGACNTVGRNLGISLYNNLKEKALTLHSSICGHAVSYGILSSYANSNNLNVEVLIKYCLQDSNVPSCSYGVGLALAKEPLLLAIKNCEVGFKSYDNYHFIPESFQMTSRGDCAYGYLSQDNNLKKVGNLTQAKIYCKNLSGKYREICFGIAGNSILYNGKHNLTNQNNILKELALNCKYNPNYECMQFVGKNIEQSLSFILNLTSTNNLKIFTTVVNSTCGDSSNSNACIEGFIQSHIVHTSHQDMESICNGLGKLSTYCTQRTSEHV